MFLKRLFSRLPYSGDTYLESAVRVAQERLVNTATGNFYRACVVGGDVAARLMLTHDSRYLQLWGNGDLAKAVGLMEVWATTLMLILNTEEDQDSVPGGIADGFGTLLGSDTERLKTELYAFQEAQKAEIDRRDEPGIRTFSKDIIYLRTLRALGDQGVPDFNQLPIPWGGLAEVMLAKPDLQLDITIFTDMRNGYFVLDALLAGLEKARETSSLLSNRISRSS